LLSYSPADAPPDDFIESDDFVSDDFVASDDFVSLGLADGEVVPLPFAEGELLLVSPLVEPVSAAAPDDDLSVDPLGPCASAGAATNARATASANAPVNVFIALPPTAVC